MSLEQNLSIEHLQIGDIVSCKYSYMSTEGKSFSTRCGFQVKRKNKKSISLSPLKFIGGLWTEQPIIRIPLIATILEGKVQAGPPLFCRDNDILKNTV